MSSEQHKEQRSKRLHSRQTKAKRQVAIAKMHGVEVESAHVFDKRHAMNCGDPGCSLCGNPRKFLETRLFKNADSIKLKSNLMTIPLNENQNN